MMVRRAVVLALCSLLPTQGFAESRCAGEGPKPFTDLGALTSGAELVTHGESFQDGPLEFVHWKKRKEVVYRDGRGQVWAKTLESDKDPRRIESANFPLSPVVDAHERYLVGDGDAFFQDFEILTGWLPFKAPFEDARHLFWNNDYLYSMSTTYALNGEQSMKLSRYRAGYSYAERICPNLNFKPGEGFFVAEGHRFPNVMLYRAVPRHEGKKELTVYGLNLESCRIEDMLTYNELVPGDVMSVHWLQSKGIIAVRVKPADPADAKRNLLWHRGGVGCEYLDIGEGPMFVPNYDVPLVLTTTEDYGMRFYYPEALRVSKGDTTFPLIDVRARDLRLSDDATSLILAPKLGEYGRQIIKLTLPPAPNPVARR